VVPPSIYNIAATPGTQVAGGPVNITATVEDGDSGVAGVFVEVTYPDGCSTANFSMDYHPCTTYYREEVYTDVGLYHFHIYAYDVFGNAGSSAVYTFTITGTNSPPVTTYNITPSTPDGENGWYTGEVTVTLNASDPDGDDIAFTRYRIDRGPWTDYNGSFTISSDGRHTVEFYSGDDQGTNETARSIPINIDASEPYVLLQRPLPGYLYILDRQVWPMVAGNTVIIGRITVRAIAYDTHSDIENVSFYANGRLQNVDTVYPYEWLWRGSMGYRYVYAVATNKAGLTAQSDPVLVYIFSL
jgi:hypothetical protein